MLNSGYTKLNDINKSAKYGFPKVQGNNSTPPPFLKTRECKLKYENKLMVRIRNYTGTF